MSVYLRSQQCRVDRYRCLCFRPFWMRSKTFLWIFLGFIVVTLTPAPAEEPPYHPQPLPEYGEPPTKGQNSSDINRKKSPRKSRSVRKNRSQRYSRSPKYARKSYQVRKKKTRKYKRIPRKRTRQKRKHRK